MPLQHLPFTTLHCTALRFPAWFLLLPRFDRSFLSLLLSQIGEKQTLSLSLLFSDSNGSARQEGGRDLSFHREGNVFGQSLRDHPNICFHFKDQKFSKKKHPFSKGNLCSLFSADRFYLSLAKIEQNPSQEHNKILTPFLLLAATLII